ncbi:MAG: hypothetical protein K2Q23_15700 [Bryobacteraceae bacterium]|nr:hypothetical protein [Bryobacteraceae bacterium]
MAQKRYVLTGLWVAWGVTSLLGQAVFSDLAATTDGQTLYFVTSLGQRGMNQPGYAKLFKWTLGQGLELVSARERSPIGSQGVSNFYQVSKPMVDSLGRVTYVLERDCFGLDSFCNSWRWGLNVRGEDQALNARALMMTGNGRFVMTLGYAAPGQQRYAAIDLDGEIPPVGSLTSPVRSGGGRFVTPGGELIWEWRSDPEILAIGPGGRVRQLGKVSFGGAVTPHPERNGALVAGENLQWFNADTGAFTQVARGRCGEVQFAGGDWFVARCGGGFWRGELFGAGGLVALPAHLQDEVAEYVPARRGEVIWYQRPDGRIRRFDAVAGTTTAIAEVPAVRYGGASMTAPGALGTVAGVGFPRADAAPPYPTELAGVRMKIDGHAVPIVSIRPDRLTVQVPRLARSGEVPWTLELPASDPAMAFETTIPRTVLVGGRMFYLRETPVKADWSGLVTPSDPASPGDLVHLLGAGLGEVEGAAEDGVPTPLGAVWPLRKPMECYADNFESKRPMRVAWAGLAPGFLGLYQVTVEVVDWGSRLDPGTLRASCDGLFFSVPLKVY